MMIEIVEERLSAVGRRLKDNPGHFQPLNSFKQHID